MARELKVYNRFDELILHLRFVPGDSFPLRVVLGSRELREAVRVLNGQDFDRTVVVDGQHRRFMASWASQEYLDALAGYWVTNFQWRIKTIADDFPDGLTNTRPIPTTDPFGLGGEIHNRLDWAESLTTFAAGPPPTKGGSTDLYSSGLISHSKPQGRLDPSHWGLAIGMVPQGGSAYGPVIRAHG